MPRFAGAGKSIMKVAGLDGIYASGETDAPAGEGEYSV